MGVTLKLNDMDVYSLRERRPAWLPTLIQFKASRKTPPKTPYRRRIGGWQKNCTPTSTQATRKLRNNSRKCQPRMIFWATPTSARGSIAERSTHPEQSDRNNATIATSLTAHLHTQTTPAIRILQPTTSFPRSLGQKDTLTYECAERTRTIVWSLISSRRSMEVSSKSRFRTLRHFMLTSPPVRVTGKFSVFAARAKLELVGALQAMR